MINYYVMLFLNQISGIMLDFFLADFMFICHNKEIEILIKETGRFEIPENFHCPTFFVDSPEEDNEIDCNTKEEINRLIAWAFTIFRYLKM